MYGPGQDSDKLFGSVSYFGLGIAALERFIHESCPILILKGTIVPTAANAYKK